MSTSLMDRRRFLTLPVALILAPLGCLDAEPVVRRGQYAADVGVLYDMLTFHIEGTIDESVDRGAGRYHVVIAGDGALISNRLEGSGRFGRAGRKGFRAIAKILRTLTWVTDIFTICRESPGSVGALRHDKDAHETDRRTATRPAGGRRRAGSSRRARGSERRTVG